MKTELTLAQVAKNVAEVLRVHTKRTGTETGRRSIIEGPCQRTNSSEERSVCREASISEQVIDKLPSHGLGAGKPASGGFMDRID